MEPLEKIQPISSVVNQPHQFSYENGIYVTKVEPGRAEGVLEVGPDSINPHGMVHGGALCTLADNAAGMAAHTDGRLYVTQSSTFQFVKNQGSGTIYAAARVRHRGRSTALVSVEITGDNHRLLAVAEFTMFCVGSGVTGEQA